MGKTYKRLPIGHYRAPRGYKRAKINKARPRTIPADGWYDERVAGKLANRPWKFFWKLKKESLPDEEIFHALKTKYKLQTWEINCMLSWGNS